MKVKVRKIIEDNLAILKDWGVPVKRVTPTLWLLNGREFVQVTVAKDGITVRFRNCFGTYDSITVPFGAGWQKELELVLSIPIEHLMTRLLCRKLRRSGFGRFAAGFRLPAETKGWVIEIFDKKRKKVILREEGVLSKSPLKAFDAIARTVSIASL